MATSMCRTTIRSTRLVMLGNGRWWGQLLMFRTPAESPELVEGMCDFWATINATKCRKYIGHLRKVFPGIIDLDGAATGY